MASASTFRWKNWFERLLHRVRVLNELGRPALAYRLSWAGTAESGYSYGYAQFDLAKGATQHRSALMRLLGEVATEAPRLAPQLAALGIALAKPVGEMTAADRSLVEGEKRAIDRALRSAAGRALIDALHTEHVGKLKGQVNPLRDVANVEARGFVRSVPGRLYIADYCNQFGAPDTFGRYVQGRPVRIGGARVSLREKLTVPVWTCYVMATKYANAHPDDIKRRLKTPPASFARTPELAARLRAAAGRLGRRAAPGDPVDRRRPPVSPRSRE